MGLDSGASCTATEVHPGDHEQSDLRGPERVCLMPLGLHTSCQFRSIPFSARTCECMPPKKKHVAPFERLRQVVQWFGRDELRKCTKAQIAEVLDPEFNAEALSTATVTSLRQLAATLSVPRAWSLTISDAVAAILSGWRSFLAEVRIRTSHHIMHTLAHYCIIVLWTTTSFPPSLNPKCTLNYLNAAVVCAERSRIRSTSASACTCSH